MTDDRMALVELIEQGADSDLVREMLAFAAERMMDLEIEARTGAPAGSRSPVRLNQQWEQVADALREKFPKLADMMDASREDVLAYMTFRKDHWAQIASTNPLERVNKEIKRRADVIGIFPNDAAIVRLVGALMLEQNDEWAVSRRYMTLETIGAVSHNPIVSLPAMAA